MHTTQNITKSQTQNIMLPPELNNDQNQFDELIHNGFFFAFCTQGYKYQMDYSREADLIINDYGMLYFFKFSDKYSTL